MLNALNTAATGMTAQSKQVEVISNNIANADTVSFKKSRAEFQDLLYQNIKDPGAATSATTHNPTGIQVGVGVKLAAVSREHTQGSLRPTGRQLDMAIQGDGFFTVQHLNGEIAFTREGGFTTDGEGRLVTSQGFTLVPEIVLPQGTNSVMVSPDGRVRVGVGNQPPQEVGQIQVTNFVNPSGLRPIGGNLYAPSEGSGEPVPGNPGDVGFGTLGQAFLESSNVQPVSEMTDMVRAQRVYEMNSKVISTSDQMLATINQLK